MNKNIKKVSKKVKNKTQKKSSKKISRNNKKLYDKPDFYINPPKLKIVD